MTTPDPHITTLLLVVTVVGYAMAYAGVAKNALEWKRRRRICPSCGRDEKMCACS
jgi:NADH pyrophosphatase NudC (nudix superfamily)